MQLGINYSTIEMHQPGVFASLFILLEMYFTSLSGQDCFVIYT